MLHLYFVAFKFANLSILRMRSFSFNTDTSMNTRGHAGKGVRAVVLNNKSWCLFLVVDSITFPISTVFHIFFFWLHTNTIWYISSLCVLGSIFVIHDGNSKAIWLWLANQHRDNIIFFLKLKLYLITGIVGGLLIHLLSLGKSTAVINWAVSWAAYYICASLHFFIVSYNMTSIMPTCSGRSNLFYIGTRRFTYRI